MIIKLYALLEVFSIILCLFYFYDKKFRLDIGTINFLFLDVIFMHTIHEGNMPMIYTMLFYGVLIVYTGLKFGFYPKPMIINILLSVLLVTCVQMGAVIIYTLCVGDKQAGGVEYFLLNLSVFLIVVLLLRKGNIRRISRFLLEKDLVVLFAVIYVSVTLLVYIVRYKLLTGMQIGKYILPVLSTFYVCLITAYLKKYKISSAQKEAELRIHNRYLQSYEKLIADIRLRQHDFDDHLNTILSQHYVCTTYEELVQSQRQYVGELREKNKFNKLLSNGNAAVIGFLYSKFTECQDKGIEISYRAKFNQMISVLPISTIIELIGNILDNAIDAVEQYEIRKIHVYISENSESIVIEIRNMGDKIEPSELSRFFKKGYSSKGTNRGIGLYNVREICNQYNIELSCLNKELDGDNWIVFSLTIKKSMLID